MVDLSTDADLVRLQIYGEAKQRRIERDSFTHERFETVSSSRARTYLSLSLRW